MRKLIFLCVLIKIDCLYSEKQNNFEHKIAKEWTREISQNFLTESWLWIRWKLRKNVVFRYPVVFFSYIESVFIQFKQEIHYFLLLFFNFCLNQTYICCFFCLFVCCCCFFYAFTTGFCPNGNYNSPWHFALEPALLRLKSLKYSYLKSRMLLLSYFGKYGTVRSMAGSMYCQRWQIPVLFKKVANLRETADRKRYIGL